MAKLRRTRLSSTSGALLASFASLSSLGSYACKTSGTHTEGALSVTATNFGRPTRPGEMPKIKQLILTKNGATSRASGFWISRRQFMTVGHELNKSKPIDSIQITGEGPTPALQLGADDTYEIVNPDTYAADALSSVQNRKFMPVQLRSDLGILNLASDFADPADIMSFAKRGVGVGERLILVGFGNTSAARYASPDDIKQSIGYNAVKAIDADNAHRIIIGSDNTFGEGGAPGAINVRGDSGGVGLNAQGECAAVMSASNTVEGWLVNVHDAGPGGFIAAQLQQHQADNDLTPRGYDEQSRPLDGDGKPADLVLVAAKRTTDSPDRQTSGQQDRTTAPAPKRPGVDPKR